MRPILVWHDNVTRKLCGNCVKDTYLGTYIRVYFIPVMTGARKVPSHMILLSNAREFLVVPLESPGPRLSNDVSTSS